MKLKNWPKKINKWIKDNFMSLLILWCVYLFVDFAIEPSLDSGVTTLVTFIMALGFFTHFRLIDVHDEARSNYNSIVLRLNHLERLIELNGGMRNFTIVNPNGNELIVPCNAQNEKDTKQ